ncbi:hypothetical protein SERLADRAFT_402039, partial [Serpula lacrymans var. lacrymans S7.9]
MKYSATAPMIRTATTPPTVPPTIVPTGGFVLVLEESGFESRAILSAGVSSFATAIPSFKIARARALSI